MRFPQDEDFLPTRAKKSYSSYRSIRKDVSQEEGVAANVRGRSGQMDVWREAPQLKYNVHDRLRAAPRRKWVVLVLVFVPVCRKKRLFGSPPKRHVYGVDGADVCCA